MLDPTLIPLHRINFATTNTKFNVANGQGWTSSESLPSTPFPYRLDKHWTGVYIYCAVALTMDRASCSNTNRCRLMWGLAVIFWMSCFPNEKNRPIFCVFEFVSYASCYGYIFYYHHHHYRLFIYRYRFTLCCCGNRKMDIITIV